MSNPLIDNLSQSSNLLINPSKVKVMEQEKIVSSEQLLEEKRDQKHRAMVSIVTRTLRHLSFMEEMKISNKTPELFLDSVYPIKQFFLMLEPQLVELREDDLVLKYQLDKFFFMVTKDINIPKTMEAYSFLKSINY
ncbi:TPA: hypothetical protein DEP30_01140 [Candidatus Nomurabacteria bacterium]|nr:MAG: hypothetical protein UR97_C0002G0114 [Candidatus Nomurabacteria bacterium GW2011_GWE2_36_115]KKP94519.1 MAG: hypothetical protein US00_C0001G0113 [Candidatus Nomurabacteria bacterium GW2011_GWF2_36_126]KKP96981.1 MAG: hypothetical protein US04_C0001G0484 [Candidatus Nomurabacteria bacterium GW2011_GWD2_36_14]KKP99415.1 MAG: hypothetical protein US08_C0001G0097 [Candidatus Nomurabacteria bacterium GW2011_GWF2_36_19]KKQ05729.1 MAG: hypothetical protein US17_C0002G0113 [Candidatus Nomuraba